MKIAIRTLVPAAGLFLLAAAPPTSPANPALSQELQCAQAYGMALGQLGMDGAPPYFTMGGYFLGRYSLLYTAPVSSVDKQVPQIPPARLKDVLAKCKAEADSAAKDLLG